MRLRVVRLDPDLHDRAGFSCGNSHVDSFLKSTAAQAAQSLKSATFVLVRSDTQQTILGFYTLAQHGYRDGELRQIPTILLGQLGIAADFQNRGLGRVLLKDALVRSLGVAQEIGAVAIVTDPYDERAQAFYEKYDFKVIHEQPFLRMMLPMRTLARAMAASIGLLVLQNA